MKLNIGGYMKLKKIISAILAAAITLSACGCSGKDSLTDYYAPQTSAASSKPAESSPAGEEPQRVFEDGATLLSVTNGSLEIDRRKLGSSSTIGGTGWTILVYMCGSDLESEYQAATGDIIEAISAQYSEDVHIVFQTGGSTEWASGISNTSIGRYVNIDGDVKLVEELRDANMGDPKTLADFVSWGIENYPAKRMGLVFWDHGGGSINGVCFDEKNDFDSLSLREIDRALNSVYDKMTDKFEFIGFDACLMSTLETANILVPYARYMFASEENEPGGGWNYTDIMNFLAENPDAAGAQLGEMQCASFYQHCKDANDYLDATFAITDLSKIDELLLSFDKTARQLYESGMINRIARSVYYADNFGGNNRSEGFTNMVDLKGFLSEVSAYAPNSADTIRKLDDAIVCSVSGERHKDAGGLSLYYPLAVQGSMELSIFSEICTSAYYLALVDTVAYGTTGGDVYGYDNSGITGDSDDFWGNDYSASDNVGTDSGLSSNDNCAVKVTDVYFDDDGIYTVKLKDMDAYNYTTCCMFMEFDNASVYLGEDDDVIIDYDKMMLQDNFDGSWLSLGDIPLMIEPVSVVGDVHVYTCPILLNGEETNLRFEYDFNAEQWNVIGTWSGIDPETGAAGRDTVSLKYGDVITPLYIAIYDDGYTEYIDAGDYVVRGNVELGYYPLWDGDFSYSMIIYDVYGCYTFTEEVGFTLDEYGDVYFYTYE